VHWRDHFYWERCCEGAAPEQDLRMGGVAGQERFFKTLDRRGEEPMTS
jgi:hypothetical protein